MLFLSATAAAERYLRRQRPAGRTYGPSVFRPVGRGQRRKEREEGEDLLTFVRPSVRSSKIALSLLRFGLSQSAAAAPLIDSARD